MNWIICGDSFEEIKNVESKSVDMILEDMPYNITTCDWDCKIDLEKYWESRKRIIKDNGAIVLFGSEPFSSALRMSNIKNYKYDWVWDKKIPSGMCNAKIMPMKQHEIISVFINGKNFYYPQMTKRDKPIKSGGNKDSISAGNTGIKGEYKKIYTEKYPTSNLVFDKIRRGSLHRTQKPLELFKYLIRTYTNENDLVFDGFLGSGTTTVACKELNRKYIGIEKEQKYFEIANKRLQQETIF